MSHDCRRTQLLMGVYGELDPAEQLQIDAAVEECGSCAGAWSDELLVRSHLAMIPELSPPPGLRSSLHDIPDMTPGRFAPSLDDMSVRLLLVLAAALLWWFMLTAGQAGLRMDESSVEGPSEQPIASGEIAGTADEVWDRPDTIARERPVILVTPRAVVALVDEVDSAAPAFIAPGPPARSDEKNDGASGKPITLLDTGVGQGVAAPSARTTPEPGGPHSNEGGGEGGPIPGTENKYCVTVDVRAFFDSDDPAGDCTECGNGEASLEEKAASFERASGLPEIQVGIDRVFADETTVTEKEETFANGHGTIKLECDLFRGQWEVVLRSGGDDACPAPGGTDEGFTMVVPFDGESGSLTEFWVPVRNECPISTPTAPAPTSTPSPSFTPEPTEPATPEPPPTAPSTPEPLDPDPVLPTEEPTAVPTATFQPPPTATSSWPQEGVSPAP